MPANEIDLQPSDLEVLQAEHSNEPAVKVHVTGIDSPVRTQVLPRKAGATRTYTAVTTVPRQVLWADHRRASARIVSVGQAMLVALSAAAKEDPSTMALWPANTVLLIEADCPVFVASQTGTTSISVITEFWATGE